LDVPATSRKSKNSTKRKKRDGSFAVPLLFDLELIAGG
jgi:hypothetical protein